VDVSQVQAAPAEAKPSPHTVAVVGAPMPAPKRTEDVPKLLNQWQVAAVAVCLVFGVLSALLQFLGWQANGRAADNTEQLVRVQEIQSTLFRADALATNAFLAGELGSAEQRANYDEAIDAVLRGITDAADAQPADREALAALNSHVSSYASAVTQARDNNRQGFPIGAEYLQDAGRTLRAEALPILEELVAANSERAEDEMGGQHPVWLFWVGILALVALWWLNRQIARRFHRRINVGLAAAAIGVAVVTIVAVLLAQDQAGDNDDLVEGSYQRAVDGASVRTMANDAKANESLRLIKRGSGQDFEDAWAEAAEGVEQEASHATGVAWDDYAVRHAEIVQLDESGQWADAVDAATTTEAGGSSAAFEVVDHSAQADVDRAAQETTDTLRSGRWFAIMLAMATLLLGLAAASLCAWGINQRRKEYA
jgi:hypothetical protein